MLAGRNILITGAAGRIGSALADSLRQLGARVVGIDLQPAEFVEKIDLTNPGELAGFFQGKSFDFGIHAAALAHNIQRFTPSRIMGVNHIGTRNLLQALPRPIALFLFFSTISVYSPADGPPLSAHTVPHPPDPYGQSKKLAEEEVIRSGLPFSIVRLAPVYSKGITSDLVKRVPQMGPITLLLSPSEKRFTFLHLDTLVKRVVDLLAFPQANTIRILADAIPLSPMDIMDYLGQRPRLALRLNAKAIYGFANILLRAAPGSMRVSLLSPLQKLLCPPAYDTKTVFEKQ